MFLSPNKTLIHFVVRVLGLMMIMILTQRMFCTPRKSCLTPRHPTSDLKSLNLDVRVGTYLLGRQSSRRYPTSVSSTCHTWNSSSSCNPQNKLRILSSLRLTDVPITQWSSVSTSAWLVVVSLCRATLTTMSGTYFWGIPLHLKKVPTYTSIL